MNNLTIPDDCVVLDTETTGFSWQDGDRIVEIGAVIMENKLPTKQTFHRYLNPQRIVPQDAVNVHGLTTERLANEPLFVEVAEQFLDFIGDRKIAAHNAKFDAGFINFELDRIGLPTFPETRFIDTLEIAKRKFPGSQANLNALCRRFKISLEGREFHGAMLDAFLLSEVCVELSGGRQASLFQPGATYRDVGSPQILSADTLQSLLLPANANELELHGAMIKKLGDDSIWNKLGKSND